MSRKSENTSFSLLSTAEIDEIIEELRKYRHRSSTRRSYYSIWKQFNKFFVRLDNKPETWEHRILLYTAYLIHQGKQSSMVKSYISGLRAVLADINVKLNDDTVLLNSLIRACKLRNDKVRLRLPIQKPMLHMILQATEKYFMDRGQVYLAKLYLALFAMTYFGLFCVGEVTSSDHVVKAGDVQMGTNKRKLLFILRSSTTHSANKEPQMIKISSVLTHQDPSQPKMYCPYQLLDNYIKARKLRQSNHEQFFVFRDRSAVKPHDFRNVFKAMITLAGFDHRNYGTHSLHTGRSLDLLAYGLSVETIKKIGRWTSNAIYRYLKTF